MPPAWPTCASGATCPKDRLVELLATGDIHVVPLQARAGPRQRAVEDVLDPRRRPAGRRRDRRRHRGARACSPSPAAASASHPTIPTRSTTAVAALVDDPLGAAEMGRRGREWVLAAASPAAVAEAYAALDRATRRPLTVARVRRAGAAALRGAAGSIAPSWLPHRRRPRRPPPGPEGQGQARPLPGWDPVPPRRGPRTRDRAGAHRLRPCLAAGGRRLGAAARHRPLARRLRLPDLHRRAPDHVRRATSRTRTPPATTSTPTSSPPACTATTTASSTGTRTAIAPPASGPSSACSSTTTASRSPTTSSCCPRVRTTTRSPSCRGPRHRPAQLRRLLVHLRRGRAAVRRQGRRVEGRRVDRLPRSRAPSRRTRPASTTSRSTATAWCTRSPSCPTTSTW